MCRFVIIAACIAISSVATGCSSKSGPVLLKANGKVVTKGDDFVPQDGENLQVSFIPIAADGTPPGNWYVAKVDPATGTFFASGAQEKGMPPGKYRVMVELKKNKKDILNGKFNALNSPFVFDIDEDSEMLIIDLEDPPKT